MKTLICYEMLRVIKAFETISPSEIRAYLKDEGVLKRVTSSKVAKYLREFEHYGLIERQGEQVMMHVSLLYKNVDQICDEYNKSWYHAREKVARKKFAA